MAEPIVVEYPKDAVTAIKAVTAVVARLGYTLTSVDRENGLVTFETGMSMKSWAGQSMSIHVLDAGPKSQLTIGGTRNAHGAQMQVYDWGEARSIAKKVFEQLDQILGEGTVLSGDLNGGGCFVATAVYGSYEHPSVKVLRRFRDRSLIPHWFGRAFIKVYYRYGPRCAKVVSNQPRLQRMLRGALDRFVERLEAR